MVQGNKRIWRRREEDEGDWIQVKGRTRHYVPKEKQHVQIQTSKRFSVLQNEGESEKEEVRCLVIGDSRVRPLGRVFCEKKDRCAVKPGAIISEIGPAIQEELAILRGQGHRPVRSVDGKWRPFGPS